MSLTLEPVNPDFVALARGLKLSRALGPDGVREIVDAMDKYAVLVFPDQPLTQDEQVQFVEQFGPLDSGLQTKIMNKVQTRMRHNTITDISNVDASGNVAARDAKISIMNTGNQFWHTDSSYDHYPFRYSVLAAVTAVSWGGETEFADLRAAYDSLDPRTKALIADKTANFFSHTTRQRLGIADTEQDMQAYPPVRWPMVRTHPGSGRKVLWCDSKVYEVSGMSVHEGRALAHDLIEHIGQREHVYSHTWSAGDVVMWDNRAMLHRGRRFDFSERREMRRVSTVDDVPSLGYVDDVRNMA
jgi:alpha-ketoglutarate-dependent 2,4-dichlorophenoxyacetate dioxygenase